MNDGNYHHWSLNIDPTGQTPSRFFIDGVQMGTASINHAISTADPFGVKAFGSSTSQPLYTLPGEVDEVTVYSGMKRTGNFTPPTSATPNTDSNLLALWHLDGTGADSTTPLVAPNAPTIGTATAGNNQVSVAFTPAASGATATSYTATWSNGGTASGTGSPLVISGLTAGVAGTAHVYASNSGGNSGNSAESNSVTPTAAPTGITVPYNDAAILYSPYNWDDRSTYMVTAASGAYAKLAFTGTSVAVKVDVSNLSALAAGSYPIVRTVIDGLQAVDVQLTSGTTLVSRSGLASGSHTVEVLLLATDDSAGDQWSTLTNALRITGFTIDTGATYSKPTARSKTAIMFGDSIWRGYMSTGLTTVQPGSNNSAYSALPSVARAFDCEYGAVAYSGQGYEQTGNASVVPFPQAYSLYSAGRSRLVSGKLSPQPDFIFIEHGTNGTTTASDVSTMLTNLRTAAPTAKIVQIVPVGGFARANITAGVAAVADANVFLVDLGTSFQTGLTTFGTGPNVKSIDGLHPNLFENSRIAAGLGAKIQAALDGVVTPSLNARTVTLTLGDTAGLVASLTGIKVAAFDEATPDLRSAPRYKSSAQTTSAAGVLSFTMQSTLAVGALCGVSVQLADGRNFDVTAAVA